MKATQGVLENVRPSPAREANGLTAVTMEALVYRSMIDADENRLRVARSFGGTVMNAYDTFGNAAKNAL